MKHPRGSEETLRHRHLYFQCELAARWHLWPVFSCHWGSDWGINFAWMHVCWYIWSLPAGTHIQY